MRLKFGDDVPESLNMTKFHLQKQLEFNKSFQNEMEEKQQATAMGTNDPRFIDAQ